MTGPRQSDPDSFPRGLVERGFQQRDHRRRGQQQRQYFGLQQPGGTGKDFYLGALGSNVPVSLGGQMLSISGTSFSAPQIAGAVALIKEAFPSLTAAEIVDLLFETAQDVGAPGVDAIYGNGIMDIRRAFQPVGMTTLADTGTGGNPAQRYQCSGLSSDGRCTRHTLRSERWCSTNTAAPSAPTSA